ncbi:hypothetical protein V8V91_19505 [Algoriphagus halophilus]|uniref:hypothetical protein n=1 Tax=Algoriphagus halophilus TaxID=226505 RepID=UPI003A73B343
MTEKKDFRKSMIQMRKNPRIVHLAADQRPPVSESRYQREFLNRPALFFEGGEFMAKNMELPVFFGTITKINRGHYTFEFSNLASPPLLITLLIALQMNFVKDWKKTFGLNQIFICGVIRDGSFKWSYASWNFH